MNIKIILGIMTLFVGIMMSFTIIPASFADTNDNDTSGTVTTLPAVSVLAPLTNVIVEPSNNLFSLESHYVIGFTTTTTGTIKAMTITFPAGFNIASAKLILESGIGSGGISVAGQILTYTVNSAVSVPAGTNIMIDLGKIVNNAVLSNTVSITTKNTLNNIIDGPTTSPAFTLKAVSTAMLGTGSVTTPKIGNAAVTNTKIANNSINGTQIISGSITNAQLSSAAAIALAKLGAGTLPAGIKVNSANIVSGVALAGPVSIDSPTFKVDSVNHSVGIGTTSPLGKLDVMGDLLIGDNPSRADLGGNSLYLSNDAGDSHNSFRLDGFANNLYIVADSATGAAAGTGIIFRTSFAGGGETDRMIIDNFGRVGIGTNSPAAKLDVYGGIVARGDLYVTSPIGIFVTDDIDDNCYEYRSESGQLQGGLSHLGNC